VRRRKIRSLSRGTPACGASAGGAGLRLAHRRPEDVSRLARRLGDAVVHLAVRIGHRAAGALDLILENLRERTSSSRSAASSSSRRCGCVWVCDPSSHPASAASRSCAHVIGRSSSREASRRSPPAVPPRRDVRVGELGRHEYRGRKPAASRMGRASSHTERCASSKVKATHRPGRAGEHVRERRPRYPRRRSGGMAFELVRPHRELVLPVAAHRVVAQDETRPRVVVELFRKCAEHAEEDMGSSGGLSCRTKREQ
jgi:hypothetical protein